MSAGSWIPAAWRGGHRFVLRRCGESFAGRVHSSLRTGEGHRTGDQSVPEVGRLSLQAAEGLADDVDVFVLRPQGRAARRATVQMAEDLPHLVRLQSTQGELLEQVPGGMLFFFHGS